MTRGRMQRHISPAQTLHCWVHMAFNIYPDGFLDLSSNKAARSTEIIFSQNPGHRGSIEMSISLSSDRLYAQ